MRLALAALVLLATALPAQAQTQLELNEQAQAGFLAADKRLNTTYQKLMKLLDKPGQKKLVAAELAWIKFRDLQAEVEQDWYRGGSLGLMTYAQCKERLTKERIKDLELSIQARSDH